MPAYLFNLPAGIPGAISRSESSTVEPQQISTTAAPSLYGSPVAIDATSKTVRAIAASDTASSVYGFLVRPFPFSQSTGGIQSSFGAGAPPASGVVDVMRRGYMTVTNKVGTPALNAPVYVRVVANAPKAIGDIEATADSTNNVAIDATFMGAADSNGNVEISFNI